MTAASFDPAAEERSPATLRKQWWRRRIATAAAGLSVLTMIAFVGLRLLERQRWREFCASQGELSARLATTPVTRPRILDASEIGDAWEDYRAAALRVGISTREERTAICRIRPWVVPVNEWKGVPDPAEAAKVLEKYSRALANLRSATRKRSVVLPERESAFPNHWTVGLAGDLLMVSSRQLSNSGDPVAALADIAASLQLEQDVWGHVWSFDELDEILRLLATADLSESALRQIEELTRRVEAGEISLTRSLEQSRSELGRLIESESALRLPSDFRISRWEVWRHGFSLKLATCEADLRAQKLIAMAPEIERMEWSRANLICWASHRGNWDHPETNPVVWANDRDIGWSEYNSRSRRAFFRLLRAGAMTRRGLRSGSPDWPIDPWDFEPLRRRETADEWILWTGGPDGGEATGDGSSTYTDSDHRHYRIIRIPRQPR